MCMANKKEEAASIVGIDQAHLDKECIQLPTHYIRFAYMAAEAKRDVDESKAALDVVQADTAKSVRATPAKYGIEKLTESAVSAAVLVTPEYQHALKVHQKALHAHRMSEAVVWALEHKKRSLTLLVELYGLGYFSDVKISAKGKEAVQKMSRQRSSLPLKRGDRKHEE